MTLRCVEEKAVLVVEDHEAVRISTIAALGAAGLTVIGADCAAQAIRILDDNTRIAVLFSDIQMPGDMDGVGLARWVRENRPDIRVILTSGDIGSRVIEPGVCDEGPIPKPYRFGQVIERIQHQLGHLQGSKGLLAEGLAAQADHDIRDPEAIEDDVAHRSSN